MRNPKKIISGGQTGADRAALDAAIASGLKWGGYVPKGRIAEDGTVPERYAYLVELESSDYRQRTEKNVIESDATLVFTHGRLTRGSSLTIRLAGKHHKPFFHVDLKSQSETEAVLGIRDWLQDIQCSILNVAGSRESSACGIYEQVFSILTSVFLPDHYQSSNQKS